jgi:[ribosomal protein S5]-alanine N-acetyltransferase
MRLELAHSIVRPWRLEDAEALAANADSDTVWATVRDRFPHPYTLDVARAWLSATTAAERPVNFAIEVGGEAAGGIGFMLQSDVDRVSAEIGYWLGDRFWGRGVMSEVVREVTERGFGLYDLSRIFAVPFEHNVASHRVLERAGYSLEGRMRRSAIKLGRIVDQRLYSRIRE